MLRLVLTATFLGKNLRFFRTSATTARSRVIVRLTELAFLFLQETETQVQTIEDVNDVLDG